MDTRSAFFTANFRTGKSLLLLVVVLFENLLNLRFLFFRNCKTITSLQRFSPLAAAERGECAQQSVQQQLAVAAVVVSHHRSDG